MKHSKQLIAWSGAFACGFILIAAAVASYAYAKLNCLPPHYDLVEHRSLASHVVVRFDRYGLPVIEANSRHDAMFALGYSMARDRFLQMDLIRRSTGGTLAELVGPPGIRSDVRHRRLNLRRVAEHCIQMLPRDQLDSLEAFAEGANALLSHSPQPSPEYVFLGAKAQPWTPQDSVLCLLSMFEQLSLDERHERMLTVMHDVLPPDVCEFLTPDSDPYLDPELVFIGGAAGRRGAGPVPAQEMTALLEPRDASRPVALLPPDPVPVGSNAWALRLVSDPRAILANDMHLALALPNIWYRCVVSYSAVRLNGVALPGTPLLAAGTNGKVAWGFTTAYCDVMDLVELPRNALKPDGSVFPNAEGYTVRHERIEVKGGKPYDVDLTDTPWGPLLPGSLLGRNVALKWTGLDPAAVNFGLAGMDKAATVDEAIAVLTSFGGPPLNAIIADSSGNIGWTLVGRIPRRFGWDGATSRDWSAEHVGWDGYIPPAEMPRIINPACGYIVNANNRTVGENYPYNLGYGFGEAYRAHYIASRLKSGKLLNEKDSFALQLDDHTQFYDFYRDLALAALARQRDSSAATEDLRAALAGWKAEASLHAVGLPLLIEYRRRLANAIFPAFLHKCYARDHDFNYSWPNMEAPLRQLITRHDSTLLPNKAKYGDWNGLLSQVLFDARSSVLHQAHLPSLAALTWDKWQSVSVAHLLAPSDGVLGKLAVIAGVNCQPRPLPGCDQSVCVVGRNYGASERMVVSPGHEADGILEMPGGESGNPFSEHYKDQQPLWEEGVPLSITPQGSTDTIELRPSR